MATDATELAARIRRGDITAVEAVDTAIAQIEALQPQLNFLVSDSFERARDRAKAGDASGPFGGVPYLIKDMFDVIGSVTRYGSRFSAVLPPATHQGAMIDAIEASGLIIVGRSALGEFGFLPTTEPLAFGPTRNPWNLALSTGGSSGGSAAAVAAGVVPMADAADGGGSIRIPASACGLFGLKPSRGRLVGQTVPAGGFDLTVQHGLTRSVRDSATLFAATERHGVGAVYPPIGNVTTPASRRLRIGVLPYSLKRRAPHHDVQAGVDATVRLLEALGHSVRPTEWPVDGVALSEDFGVLYSNGALGVVKLLRANLGRDPDDSMLEPLTLAMAARAEADPTGTLEAVTDRMNAVAGVYDSWFDEFDVVLSPVMLTPTVRLGEIRGDVPVDLLLKRLDAFVDYTVLHNIAGAPAMSVPLHWTADGLPVGMQFAARGGNERTLFELALELEDAQPWADRKPPVFAA
jgi:amidase